MRKLGFGFVALKSLSQPKIWEYFFKNVDERFYNIYIHFKEYEHLGAFEKYRMNEIKPTSWGYFLEAQNLMFDKFLNDKDNSHFLVISDTTIPIKPFWHIYDNLEEGYSYIHKGDQSPPYGYDKTSKFVDKKFIKKTSMWVILCRDHVKRFTEDLNYIEYFNYCLGEEYAYISMLLKWGLEGEIKYKTTTHVRWPDKPSKNPCSLDDIGREDFLSILNSDYFFARKFFKKSNILQECEKELNEKIR